VFVTYKDFYQQQLDAYNQKEQLERETLENLQKEKQLQQEKEELQKKLDEEDKSTPLNKLVKYQQYLQKEDEILNQRS
jgi:hypothetical protein